MTDATPDPGSFDIVAVLQGRDFPTVEIPFYLDEKAAFSLNQLEKELTRLAGLGKTEEHDAKTVEAESLKEKIRASRYVYHLHGVENKVRDDLLAEAYIEFPRKQAEGINALLGTTEENPERDRWFGLRMLHAMTEKIVAPNGAEMLKPTVAQIQAFQERAPQAALEAIYTGQSELSQGVKAGFESAAQESDFSSAP